eukprot:m.127129 g.127129  ORF g.127129 m.127129 type:complete len:1081 (+) comp14539_c0_seq8:266-3508(+)
MPPPSSADLTMDDEHAKLRQALSSLSNGLHGPQPRKSRTRLAELWACELGKLFVWCGRTDSNPDAGEVLRKVGIGSDEVPCEEYEIANHIPGKERRCNVRAVHVSTDASKVALETDTAVTVLHLVPPAVTRIDAIDEKSNKAKGHVNKYSVEKVSSVGDFYNQAGVIQVSWHPLSRNCLVVLTRDGMLRYYLVGSQELRIHDSILSIRVGPDPSRNQREFAEDANVVSFAFGRFYRWETFSVYVLQENGNISVFSPLVPVGSIFPEALINDLRGESMTEDEIIWLDTLFDSCQPVGTTTVNSGDTNDGIDDRHLILVEPVQDACAAQTLDLVRQGKGSSNILESCSQIICLPRVPLLAIVGTASSNDLQEKKPEDKNKGTLATQVLMVLATIQPILQEQTPTILKQALDIRETIAIGKQGGNDGAVYMKLVMDPLYDWRLLAYHVQGLHLIDLCEHVQAMQAYLENPGSGPARVLGSKSSVHQLCVFVHLQAGAEEENDALALSNVAMHGAAMFLYKNVGYFWATISAQNEINLGVLSQHTQPPVNFDKLDGTTSLSKKGDLSTPYSPSTFTSEISRILGEEPAQLHFQKGQAATSGSEEILRLSKQAISLFEVARSEHVNKLKATEDKIFSKYQMLTSEETKLNQEVGYLKSDIEDVKSASKEMEARIEQLKVQADGMKSYLKQLVCFLSDRVNISSTAEIEYRDEIRQLHGSFPIIDDHFQTIERKLQVLKKSGIIELWPVQQCTAIVMCPKFEDLQYRYALVSVLEDAVGCIDTRAGQACKWYEGFNRPLDLALSHNKPSFALVVNSAKNGNASVSKISFDQGFTQGEVTHDAFTGFKQATCVAISYSGNFFLVVDKGTQSVLKLPTNSLPSRSMVCNKDQVSEPAGVAITKDDTYALIGDCANGGRIVKVSLNARDASILSFVATNYGFVPRRLVSPLYEVVTMYMYISMKAINPTNETCIFTCEVIRGEHAKGINENRNAVEIGAVSFASNSEATSKKPDATITFPCAGLQDAHGISIASNGGYALIANTGADLVACLSLTAKQRHDIPQIQELHRVLLEETEAIKSLESNIAAS